MRRLPLLVLALLPLAACQRPPELTTRTFPLHRLSAPRALALVQPYVYPDRKNAPGMVTAAEGMLTVRELPENVNRINDVLAQYDAPPTSVLLHFQLLQADGAAPVDSAIAPLEAELRRVFRFGGYRLASNAVVRTTPGDDFAQHLPGVPYELEGRVQDFERVAGGDVGTIMVVLREETTRQTVLMTTVTARAGQTIVLGTSRPLGPPRAGAAGEGALILALTPEFASPPGAAPAR